MTTLKLFSSSLLFLCLSCGGSQGKQNQSLSEANPCGGDACSASSPETPNVDWSQWSSWSKVNDAPFQSAHGKAMVDVYIPVEHLKTYQDLAMPFPVGMPVAKIQYKGADEASGIDKLTTMVKMGEGYDSDHGNWYYAVVSSDGKNIVMGGTPKSCVTCHDNAEKDYLFGAK